VLVFGALLLVASVEEEGDGGGGEEEDGRDSDAESDAEGVGACCWGVLRGWWGCGGWGDADDADCRV
jgi:hypothetical protein